MRTSDEEVLTREAYWKDVLLTRRFGLNKNYATPPPARTQPAGTRFTSSRAVKLQDEFPQFSAPIGHNSSIPV